MKSLPSSGTARCSFPACYFGAAGALAGRAAANGPSEPAVAGRIALTRSRRSCTIASASSVSRAGTERASARCASVGGATVSLTVALAQGDCD